MTDIISTGPFAGLPSSHFGGMLVDVPSKYLTYSDTRQTRAAGLHYKGGVMTLDEIKALPVRDLALPDSWVFYWTTGPQMENAFAVLKAWGLTYSGMGFTWVKLRKGFKGGPVDLARDFHFRMGHTTRKNAEFTLLAKIGHPRVMSHSVRELIVAPVREHSRKPAEAAKRVEQFATGPYIEIFACERRPNWTGWGDEVEKFSGAA